MHEDYDLMNYEDGDNTPSSNFSEGEYLIHQHLGLANWHMGYNSSIYTPMEPKQIGGEKVVKADENKDLFDELPYDADFVSTRSCDEHDLISHVHVKKIGERRIPNFNPIEKLSCNVGDNPRDCYYGFCCPICGTLIRHRKANVVQYKESNWAYTKAEFVCQHCETEFVTDPFITDIYVCQNLTVEELARWGYFVNNTEELKKYRFGKIRMGRYLDNLPALVQVIWGVLAVIGGIATLVAIGLLLIILWFGPAALKPSAYAVFKIAAVLIPINLGFFAYVLHRAYNYRRTYKAPKRKYH